MDSKTVDAGLLRSRYRLTKQRAAVLRALDDGAHLDAEAILTRVRGELAGVSLGTVYRTLEILRSIGLVQVVTLPGEATRYEAALEKHHHLFCSACRLLTNILLPALSPIVAQVAGTHEFSNTDYALTITGLCPACASKSDDGVITHSRGNSAKA